MNQTLYYTNNSFVNLSHYYLAFTHRQLLMTIVMVLIFKGYFLFSSSVLFVVQNGHEQMFFVIVFQNTWQVDCNKDLGEFATVLLWI